MTELHNQIEALWVRLKQQVARLAPGLLDGLAGPASEEDLEQLEFRLGRTLPEALKASLKVHNGEPAIPMFGVYHQAGFLSCEDIWKYWQMDEEVRTKVYPDDILEDAYAKWKTRVLDGAYTIKGNVKAKYSNPLWIPIADSNTDYTLYLDFDPPPGGTEGQIILVYPECLVHEVLADSYLEFLEGYVQELEAGHYRAHPDGCLEPVNEAPDFRGILPEYLQNL